MHSTARESDVGEEHGPKQNGQCHILHTYSSYGFDQKATNTFALNVPPRLNAVLDTNRQSWTVTSALIEIANPPPRASAVLLESVT